MLDGSRATDATQPSLTRNECFCVCMCAATQLHSRLMSALFAIQHIVSLSLSLLFSIFLFFITQITYRSDSSLFAWRVLHSFLSSFLAAAAAHQSSSSSSTLLLFALLYSAFANAFHFVANVCVHFFVNGAVRFNSSFRWLRFVFSSHFVDSFLFYSFLFEIKIKKYTKVMRYKRTSERAHIEIYVDILDIHTHTRH